MTDSASPKQATPLTARDQEVIIAALQNLKGGDIQIDYHGLATQLGLKDHRSAATTWSIVRRKLFGDKAASTGKATTPAKPKSTPRKPKNVGTATPTSGKKAPKSDAIVKDEDDDDDDDAATPDGDGEECVDIPKTPQTPTTPKKRSRKPKAKTDADAPADGDGAEGDEDDGKTPAKKTRKTPVKKTAPKVQSADIAGPVEDVAAKPANEVTKPNNDPNVGTATTDNAMPDPVEDDEVVAPFTPVNVG